MGAIEDFLRLLGWKFPGDPNYQHHELTGQVPIDVMRPTGEALLTHLAVAPIGAAVDPTIETAAHAWLRKGYKTYSRQHKRRKQKRKKRSATSHGRSGFSRNKRG